MRPLTSFLAALTLPWLGCGADERQTGIDLSRPVELALDEKPPKRLSSYNLFAWDPVAGFSFNERVVPYDLNTPLFSDHALKQRAVYIPEGAAANYEEELALELPVGSVLIKNFYFPADFRAPAENLTLIETRLLVRHADGWHPLPYIWDAGQRDAVLSPAGDVRTISFIDASGETQVANYLIPQRNQCENCHARRAHAFSAPAIEAIGLKARHLNRSYDYAGGVGVQNQLEHLAELGMLTGLPALEKVPAAYDFRPIEEGGVDAIPAADVEPAARTYLDINCAHCHEPNAVQGDTSQLFLNHDNTDPFHLGTCKRPGSAGEGTGGLTFDIVPGDPDSSILYFRTHTAEVGAMMPLLGRSLTHQAGAALVRAWIAAMPADDCVTAQ
jgi:uncharacterized repeat protein (TIGR03806 family)